MLTAKERAEKAPLANWLRETRKARGYANAREAAAYVTRETGVTGLSYSVWAAYESGGRPHISDKHLEAITSLWGQPTQQEAATPEGMAALLVELREQSAATRQLAAAVAQLAASVGQSHGLSHAAADGMTTTVLGAIETVRGILLSREHAPGDTLPPTRAEQVPDPKA